MTSSSLLAVVWALVAPADAAAVNSFALVDVAAPLDGSDEIEEQSGAIVVNGQRDGPAGISSATRTETALQDVPQAVSVVGEQQIEEQNLRSIADVTRYVPGVTAAQGEGHRDQLVLRGNNSTADFFLDGLRDDVQYYRPLYNLARIEVLRGPNAMIFGRGGGGGVVNRVTKQPFETLALAGSGAVTTFGAWHVDGDVNLPLGMGIAVRVNGTYEAFANHRDLVDGAVFAINPVARLAIGGDTAFGLSYEYVDDDRVVDRGVPSRNGRPLAGFRDTFFGRPDANRLGFQGHILRGTVEHRFGDTLRLVSRLHHADYDKFYRNAFAAAAVNAANQVGIEAYADSFQRRNSFSQTDLVWNVATGPARHTLLAGIEIGAQQTGNQRLNGFFDSGVPVSNGGRRTFVSLAAPLAIPPVTFRSGDGQRASRTEAGIFALYVQDQIEIGPFELVAGLRYDRFRLDAVNVLSGQTFGRTDELVSPRLGIVAHPVAPVSLYASYSRSYLPQSGDQFTSLDLTGAALEPERFDNYEVGAKWQATPGLLLSAALYRLDRTNSRAPGPNPGEVVQTGAQRSRGLELEAVGRITPAWQVSLAYTLQEAKIVSDTAAAPAGRDVPLVPRHQFAAWSRYDFSSRLGAGIGLIHQSRSFTSISNAVVLPGFTRLDAAFFAKLTDDLEAQVNVENLLGETYFPTAHNDNNISTGQPLTARFTLRYRY